MTCYSPKSYSDDPGALSRLYNICAFCLVNDSAGTGIHLSGHVVLRGRDSHMGAGSVVVACVHENQPVDQAIMYMEQYKLDSGEIFGTISEWSHDHLSTRKIGGHW